MAAPLVPFAAPVPFAPVDAKMEDDAADTEGGRCSETKLEEKVNVQEEEWKSKLSACATLWDRMTMKFKYLCAKSAPGKYITGKAGEDEVAFAEAAYLSRQVVVHVVHVLHDPSSVRGGACHVTCTHCRTIARWRSSTPALSTVRSTAPASS